MEDGYITSYGQPVNTDLLPIILQSELSLPSINEWLKKRRIPEKREGLKEARMMFPGFEEDRNEFSLSDQYWFKYNKNESWDELNFFTNGYSSAVGDVFFQPWEVDRASLKETSPDRTTNGVLIKCWQRDDEGNSWLLKAGSKRYHQEPLSEVLASQVLKRLDIIPFVEYSLTIHGLKMCSKCRNFIDENTEFVPATHIYKKEEKPADRSVYDHLKMMCRKWRIDGAEEFIDKMIAVDSIIGNNDRNLGNFGFIRNVESGVITGCAPLFDCGRAYWGYALESAHAPSRLFNDVERKVTKKILKHVDPYCLDDMKKMTQLVSEYAEINEEVKDNIKSMLLYTKREVMREIEKSSEKAKEVDEHNI